MCVCVWEGGDRRGADGSSPVEGQVKRNETNSGLQDLPADGGMNQRHEPANEAIGQVHFDPSRHVQFDPSRHVQFDPAGTCSLTPAGTCSLSTAGTCSLTTAGTSWPIYAAPQKPSTHVSDQSGPPTVGRGSERAAYCGERLRAGRLLWGEASSRATGRKCDLCACRWMEKQRDGEK